MSRGFLLSKLTGLRHCVADNGWYYTWHHFVGKIGRRTARLPGCEGLSRHLLAYAHELKWFVPREGGSGEILFPAGTENLRWRADALPAAPRRVALFAVFSYDGHLPETTHLYLRGLGQVADAVVCVGDCPLFPTELEKLKGEVTVARFERHGEYDFGSYRRAYRYAEEGGLLSGAPEVILANDSCYGPVYPFAEVVATMAARNVDFWGLTTNYYRGSTHLQSYFYFFGPRVIASGAVKRFLLAGEGQRGRRNIIEQGEMQFTAALAEQGFTWSSYVAYEDLHNNPSTFPVSLLARRCPLVKVKALDGESHESVREAMRLIRQSNPVLMDAIEAKIAAERNPERNR